jgi:hypothetical protein
MVEETWSILELAQIVSRLLILLPVPDMQFVLVTLVFSPIVSRSLIFLPVPAIPFVPVTSVFRKHTLVAPTSLGPC